MSSNTTARAMNYLAILLISLALIAIIPIFTNNFSFADESQESVDITQEDVDQNDGDNEEGEESSDEDSDEETDSEDENDEDNGGNFDGFPESYQEDLQELQNEHPSWKFKAKEVNVDFDKAVDIESEGS